MRDRYLVGVVSMPYVVEHSTPRYLLDAVQSETRQHARCKEFRHGSLRMCPLRTTSHISSQRSFQATSSDGKDGGIELVKPPENSKIGDKVYFEGSEYESENVPPWYDIHGI